MSPETLTLLESEPQSVFLHSTLGPEQKILGVHFWFGFKITVRTL